MIEHVRADADASAIRADGAAGVSGVVVGAATDVGRSSKDRKSVV